MKNKIILSFLIILTLFLTISCASADENATDVLAMEDNSSSEIIQADSVDDGSDGVNLSETEISASDVVSYTNLKDKFTVKLTSNGTKLANKSITITLNGVNYTKKTNSKGEAAVDFKLKTGNYEVHFSFLGDSNYTACNGTATIKIKSDLVTYLKVADNDINYREGSKTLFQLKLIDVNNKPVGSKTIKIKVAGKTYKAKTNSKGVASFYLKLKKGTRLVEYSFSKSGKYLSSKGCYKIKVKSQLKKANGYWVNRWSMNKVNLKKLSKLGTRHIFLLHTSFDMYGKTKVIKWIKKAHKYGMKVHMWMAVFYKDGKYIHASNKKGEYNYKHMDSIIKKAKRYAGYKEVDGIHFDYLRFGGNAYKYKNSVNAINYFVKKASKDLRSIRENIIISAAVMPEPTSMKYYYGQDVPTMSKYFDAVVPMIYKGNYYAGTKWIKKTTKQFVKQSNGAKIWSGLQTYDSDWNIEKLPYKELMKDAKAAKYGGASGIILFRWGLSALLNFKKI